MSGVPQTTEVTMLILAGLQTARAEDPLVPEDDDTLVAIPPAGVPLTLEGVSGWGDHKWGEKFPGTAYKMADGQTVRVYCKGKSPFPTTDVVPCPNAPTRIWDIPVKSVWLIYNGGILDSIEIGSYGDACSRLEYHLGASVPFVEGHGMEWASSSRRVRVYQCSDVGTHLQIDFTGELPGIQGTLSYLASKKDFRGLEWGSLPGYEMEPGASAPNSVRQMIRASDELKLGDYALSGITYTYYNDQLFMVSMDMPPESTLGVLEVFQQAYGAGDQENRYIDHWDWTTPNFKMRLLYDIALGTKEGHAIFIYLPLFSEYTEAREKAAREAVQGL